MKTIEIIYIKAGNGHLASAKALQTAIELAHKDCYVRLTDLRDIIGHLDPFPITPEQFYNWMVNHDFIHGQEWWLKIGKLIINNKFNKIYIALKEYFEYKLSSNDVVVSVIPNFNKVLYYSTIGVCKFITIMTDFIDYAQPHTWIEDNASHLLVGTNDAYQQAVSLRDDTFTRKNVFQLSGLMVHPKFYEHYNMMPRDNTVVVYGFGHRKMMDIARKLATYDKKVIFICGGNNQKLINELTSYHGEIRRSRYIDRGVIGFTDAMPSILNYSGNLITKPGPGIISEAEVSRIRIITTDRAMFHEKYNLDYIWNKGLGFCLTKSDWNKYLLHFVKEVTGLYYTNKPIKNLAVFEAADFVANL